MELGTGGGRRRGLNIDCHGWGQKMSNCDRLRQSPQLVNSCEQLVDQRRIHHSSVLWTSFNFGSWILNWIRSKAVIWKTALPKFWLDPVTLSPST